MTKILFFFDGTHLEGQGRSILEKDTIPHEDTIRIYFKGCHGRKTGGNGWFPDIAGAAKRLVSTFTNDTLDLDALKRKFDTDVVIEPFDSAGTSPKHYGKVSEIDEILLAGYSRGGVTAFAVAKELNHCKKQTPVRIIANQPVPGNYYNGAGTVVSEVEDLSMCTNIKTASVIVGSYTKQVGFSGANQISSFFHRIFFRQVVPFFSKTVKANIIECPINSHFSSLGVRLGYEYMINELQQYGYCRTRDPEFNIKETVYKTRYLDYEPLFLHIDEKHLPFGDINRIKLDPLYQEALDELTDDILLQRLDANITKFVDDVSLLNSLVWAAELSNEQKKAICSLARRCPDKESLEPMISMILNKTPQGEKLIKIINSTSLVIAQALEHLSHRSDNKRKCLMENKDTYLWNMFKLSYEFLTISEPTEKDKRLIRERLLQINSNFINDNKISERLNPKLDACITLIKNLVFGILSLGTAYIYNAVKNKPIFFVKEVESKVRLEEGVQKIHEELLNDSLTL
ncbi:hypothetical protein [Legionella cardiaca]|uniref:Dot/Icm T4SS effector n=1 Tax=Legionella cardiaca TaxID=1071983 RepID=A0ABY8ATK0_9GAMM|nr:hypothetical protein [Legionella cardiaca]WED42681.1 hypothetical protein PXX05_12355 [Legionella cardiaca]